MLRNALALLGHVLGGRQADRYVLRETYRLLSGGRHSVLGNRVKDESAARSEAADFLQDLRRLGLKRDHRCIEIGCGSLWAAEPVIEFLHPGCFLGLDVTDLFFNPAKQRLSPAMLSEKRPEFAVLSGTALAGARALCPDFIFSRRTLVHVPPQELRAFLGQACALMTRETTCVHETPGRPIQTCRFNRYSWVHSYSDVRAALPPGFRLEYRDGCHLVRKYGN